MWLNKFCSCGQLMVKLFHLTVSSGRLETRKITVVCLSCKREEPFEKTYEEMPSPSRIYG